MNYTKNIIIVGFIFIFLIISLFSAVPLLTNLSPKTDDQIDNDSLSAATLPDISDNLETYRNITEFGSIWTLYNGTGCSIDLTSERSHSPSNSIRLVDTSIGGESHLAYMYRIFGNKTTYLYTSLYIYALYALEILSVSLRNATGHSSIEVGLDLLQFYYVSNNQKHSDWTWFYSTNTWYHFELLYDIANQSFSFYIDNIPYAENVPTNLNIVSVDRIFITTSSTLGFGSARFYVDDITVRDWHIKLETIQNGTPINSFNEKLLLDADQNNHLLNSTEVDGTQQVSVQYQYNFSEIPPEAIESIALDYSYDTSANKKVSLFAFDGNISGYLWEGSYQDTHVNSTTSCYAAYGGLPETQIFLYFNLSDLSWRNYFKFYFLFS
ncbi:MAG: hypothetical protein ACFFD2_23770 [Promethearchaeota archaeon]